MRAVSAVVAAASNGVIGRENELPWHLPADLKHFRRVTLGKSVLMGRKTFESIGRVLDGRCNIVLTRDESAAQKWRMQNPTKPSPVWTTTLDQAFAAGVENQELVVIGGAEIYAMTRKYWTRVFLTRIERDFDGDSFFADLEEAKWRLVQSVRHPPGELAEFAVRFEEFERRQEQ